MVHALSVNFDKVLERGKKIAELDDGVDALQAGASQLESKAGKLGGKCWWRNCKVGFLVPWSPPAERS